MFGLHTPAWTSPLDPSQQSAGGLSKGLAMGDHLWYMDQPTSLSGLGQNDKERKLLFSSRMVLNGLAGE